MYENNYKYSQVRAFLNGTEYYYADAKSPAAAKKWLDYGVEHRARKIVKDKIEPTFEFTESVLFYNNP